MSKNKDTNLDSTASSDKDHPHQEKIVQLIKELQPFAVLASHVQVNDNNLFECAARASFSKCYSYTMFSHSLKPNDENSFYFTGTLRSICEDLIVLRYMRDWNAADKNRLIKLDMQISLLDQLERQTAFFKKFKPGQHVMTSKPESKNFQEALVKERKEIWRRHGYTLKRSDRPSTRAICEKLGMDALSFLYEYIYSITSDTVHFNAKALMRTGWGEIPQIGDPKMHFSPINFSIYKVSFCRVYSSLLLTIYFEFFSSLLNPTEAVIQHVKELRRELVMTIRWPEMVTFEEINLCPLRANPLFAVIRNLISANNFEEGFINGQEILD